MSNVLHTNEDKAMSILDKLLNGKMGKVIAYEEGVSNSAVSSVKTYFRERFPLFLGLGKE